MKFQIARSLLFASWIAVAAAAAQAPACAGQTSVWPSLRAELFNQAPITENDGVVILEAPDRAEDAALVPITITLPDGTGSDVRKVTLLIDENPAPVAAIFTFAQPANGAVRTLETRVRVDRYSFIRAVAETADGKLHMAAHFVKASGGCSAPASKDSETALRNLGKMQITSRALSAQPAVAQTKIMIRHPNYSGLQIDEVTRGYRPAHFVSNIEVRQGEHLIMSVDGGISIAENPHFLVVHASQGNEPIAVTARDTEGGAFSGRSDQSGS